MATFYLDYEGGNDASDGTTFANRWKTLTSGATAARIAPGDTIRVMGSPAPTSLSVNGTWTDGPKQGTISITSSTNATPIVVTKASHGLTTGDIVVVTGHTTNTNANGTFAVNVLTSSTFELSGSVGNGVGGASGTFRQINNCCVKLASAVTKEIQNCGFQSGAWTASANVTATIETTDFKEGYGSSSIAIAAGFTTGLAAYKALGALTDFSAYKQISFWIKQTAGTIGASGAITISLCTDTIGAVAANTINVPLLGALNQWQPITVDTGGALSALIQSIAINVITDNGAQTFLLDNFTACKDSTSADSLSLTSLIGKNTGTESWCGIQSINGKIVILDQNVNATPITTTWRGYSGVTETVTAYKRETIKTAMAATNLADVQALTDQGSTGSLIAFEGGWDRTAMTTQNLETWFDGQNGFGKGISGSGNSGLYNSFNKISTVRYHIGYSMSVNGYWSCDNLHANNNSASGIGLNTSYRWTGTVYSCSYNGGSGISFSSGTSANRCTPTRIYALNGNGAAGMTLGSSYSIFRQIDSIKNNATFGIVFSSSSTENFVANITTKDNASGAVQANSGTKNYLRNATLNEATEVTVITAGSDDMVFSELHDATVDNSVIFCDGGKITSQTTTRHTASGVAWQFQPTSATRNNEYPLRLSVAKVACAASALVTVKAWLRRDNTGLTVRLVCRGGQIAGVASDQVASMAASANTWEENTITFTPTEAGTVEIVVEAYGGTTYNGYVDDMTISQA